MDALGVRGWSGRARVKVSEETGGEDEKREGEDVKMGVRNTAEGDLRTHPRVWFDAESREIKE